nr:tail fiber domain-containing protein [uncultured Leclercia sp.]
MTKYATMNPPGSASPYDLFDNSQNFDTAINSITAAIWQDRLGKSRHTWYGIESLALKSMLNYGYITKKSFEQGATLDTPNTVLQLESNGEFYRWDGDWSQPKVVPPGSTPESAGGVGPGKWVGVGDAALRSGLSKPDGASLIGGATYGEIRAYGGAANRINCLGRSNIFDHAHGDFVLDTADTTSADNDGTVLVDASGRRWKRQYDGDLVLTWFGAKGDGTTDNAAAFQKADAVGSAIALTGNGVYFSTYAPLSPLVTTGGASLKLGTQTYLLSSVPQAISAYEQTEPDGVVVRLSNLKAGLDCAPELANSATSYANTLFGTSAGKGIVEDVTRLSAFGGFICKELVKGYSIDAYGTNVAEWMNYADRITLVGANAGKNLGGANPVGRHLYFKPEDPDPNGWDARWPGWRTYAGAAAAPAQVMTAANYETKATHIVGVGRNSFGFSITASDSVGVGYDSCTSLLYGQDCVGVGDRVMQWTIKADFSTFVGSKAARSLMDSYQDTGVGYLVGANYVHSKQNTLCGYQVMAGFQCNLTDVPELNCFFGRISAANAKGSIKRNAGFGPATLASVQSDDNSAFGSNALLRLSDPLKGRNTAAGADALILMQDLSNCTSIENSSGLGYQARVSGDNQVQLGNAATTTYVYGTVQNRSDINDKADVRDTRLDIDFIMGLRPVDGRWDMREDYAEEYQVQIGIDEEAQPVFETRIRKLPKDGSKKRERFHHWFIAQEVKELCDKLGVEFGGYQDHSVNGGCDVLSLGYDEFIPPTVKAVQQCWERMDAQEKRINAQDAKIEKLEEILKKLSGQ